MPSRKASTRDRILRTLNRRGACTVTDLARGFRISTMAVRLQLAALESEGLVRTDCTRPSRGRPARAYALTPAARECFPDRAGPLALALLEEVEAIAGREVVVEALRRRAKRLAESYADALDGKGPADRLRILAQFRDQEGYVAEAESRGNGSLPDVVERHCPISALAKRWPEVCRIEEELMREAFGGELVRTEHMLTGGGCCRYRAGEV